MTNTKYSRDNNRNINNNRERNGGKNWAAIAGVSGAALIAVIGFLFMYPRTANDNQAGTTPTSVTADLGGIFRERLTSLGTSFTGQTAAGFDATALMNQFPGLTREDFNGVETVAGRYELRDNEIAFVSTSAPAEPGSVNTSGTSGPLEPINGDNTQDTTGANEQNTGAITPPSSVSGSAVTDGQDTDVSGTGNTPMTPDSNPQWISNAGYSTLLSNVAQRLGISLTDAASVDAVIAAINTAEIISAKIGETVSSMDVQISPASVAEDSRCPSGANCIEAGRVRITARIGTVGGTLRTQSLTTDQPFTSGDAVITLIRVEPLPQSQGERISPSDYTFYFQVRDASPDTVNSGVRTINGNGADTE